MTRMTQHSHRQLRGPRGAAAAVAALAIAVTTVVFGLLTAAPASAQVEGPVTITVTQQVVGGQGDEVFEFTYQEETIGALGDGESMTFTATYDGTPIRFYEVVPPAWGLTGVDCDQGLIGRGYTGSIRLTPQSSTVNCVVTTTAEAKVDLTIVVETDVETDDEFRFRVSGDDVFVRSSQPLVVEATTGGIRFSVEQQLEGGPISSPVWELVDVSCDRPHQNWADRILIAVAGISEVTCTFVNEYRPVTYNITNEVTVGSPAIHFDFTITNTTGAEDTALTVRAGSTVTVVNETTGYARIQQVIPTGWALERANCSGGEELVQLGVGRLILNRVEGGEVVNCTFVNHQVSATAPQPRILTLPGRSDGWVEVGRTRNWVSAACRSELESEGAIVQEVTWPRVAVLVDATPFRRCPELIASLFETDVRLVTLPGRSDAWLDVDGTRNWVSAACRSELESEGAAVQEVSWPELAELVDATPFRQCDALLADYFVDDPLIVTLPGRVDGWLQVDGTRNWVSASCRSELQMRGVSMRSVSWSTLSSLPDAAPFQRCPALIADLLN